MREVPGFLRDLETELSKKDTPLVDSKYAPKLPKGVKRPTALTISADYRPLNVDTTAAVQGLEPEEDMDAHDSAPVVTKRCKFGGLLSPSNSDVVDGRSLRQLSVVYS